VSPFAPRKQRGFRGANGDNYFLANPKERQTMTTRERWIVYPLLFLTLGMAMRNQFLPTRGMGAVDFIAGKISAQTILCDNLEVRQDEKCRNLQFGDARGERLIANYSQSMKSTSADLECPKFTVTDPQGKPVIIMLEDQNTKAGVIQTMRADGAPQVQIRSNDTGGIVTAIGHLGQVLVAMGHEGQAFGVFAQFPQVGPPFPLTSPWRFQSPPAKPKITPPDEKKEEPKKDEPNPKSTGNP
jgi:hypothetical protein